MIHQYKPLDPTIGLVLSRDTTFEQVKNLLDSRYSFIARDWIGRPVAIELWDKANQPRIEYNCCGDPGWSWSCVRDVRTIPGAYIPAWWPRGASLMRIAV